MHYLLFLLPLAILLLCASRGASHSTWAPFQSDQVKEICAHMTAEERSRTFRRAAAFGAVLGVLIGGLQLMAIALGKWLFDSSLMGMMSFQLVILIPMGIALWKFKPRIDRSQKAFLASIQWSKDEGLSSDDIVLRRS
jgi:ABC-type spermidine/putrescine transport system permease subunit II